MNAPASPDAAAPLTVLAVDDHALLLEGIAAVLGTEPGIRLVGQARSGREAIEAHRRLRPDVTLMDVRMPDMDGIDAMSAIRAEQPQARFVILTTFEGDVTALRAIKAGAMGYLLKSEIRVDLARAIRDAASGRRHVPPEIATLIAQHAADEPLSRREIEVLEHVAAGRSNKRVAHELAISEETVKAHMRSIMAKLGADDRTHAVTIAVRRGYLSV